MVKPIRTTWGLGPGGTCGLKVPAVPWKQTQVLDQVRARRVAPFQFGALLLNAMCRAGSRGLQGARPPPPQLGTEQQLSPELLELGRDGGV